MELNKSKESKNFRREDRSNRLHLLRWRGNVGTRYLEPRDGVARVNPLIRIDDARPDEEHEDERRGGARRARTRNDRIADLPYRCNESKGPASTGPTDADPSSRQRRSPWKGTTDNTRRALLLPLQPALNWI